METRLNASVGAGKPRSDNTSLLGLGADHNGEKSIIPNGHVVFIFHLVTGRDDDLL